MSYNTVFYFIRKLWEWVRWYIDAKLFGWDVCRPDCVLCEASNRCEAHYDACLVCQGDGYPCAAMEALDAEEQKAIDVVFPELIPAVFVSPWDCE